MSAAIAAPVCQSLFLGTAMHWDVCAGMFDAKPMAVRSWTLVEIREAVELARRDKRMPDELSEVLYAMRALSQLGLAAEIAEVRR